MADPITGLAALGAVSNVFQVLDFSARVVKETCQLIQSSDDALRENIVVERMTRDYQTLSNELKSSFNINQLAPQEETTKRLAESCGREAARLLDLLEDLKVAKGLTGLKRTYQSARQVARARAKKKAIETQQKQLQVLNGQLATALLDLLRHNQSGQSHDINHAIRLANSNNVNAVINAKTEILTAISNLSRTPNVSKILSGLEYPEMRLRRNAIAEAHQHTFEWIDADCTSPLVKRIYSSERLFWLSGKAGSGKSTLMKFISHSKSINEHLATWASGRKLVVVSSYLWNPGLAMQRSQEGLLRSILHSLYSDCPSLALISAPSRFIQAANCTSIGRNLSQDNIDTSWTLHELSVALESIASSNSLCCKICLFLDGLDEYEGDHLRLVEIVKRLAMNPDIKVCASSRPWNIFDRAFRAVKDTFRLEDLTRNDIQLYVRDELKEVLDTVSGAEGLLWDVVDKAGGVFLWVFLVVRSLREGFGEGDSLATMRKRVADFPADLEDFFRHILTRVNKIYQAETAKALNLAMRTLGPGNAQHHRSFISFWLLSQGKLDEVENLPKIQPVAEEDISGMVSETKRYLSASCKDLLHMPKFSADQALEVQNPLYNRVEFLHRTVHDFLDSPDMQMLLDKNSPNYFSDSHFPIHIAVAAINVVPLNWDSGSEHVWDIALNALQKYGSSCPRVLIARLVAAAAKHVALCDIKDLEYHLSDERDLVNESQRYGVQT